MQLIIIILPFIVGFLLGGVVTYLTITKQTNKSRLRDEITKSRRELTNTKRQLEDFFVKSRELLGTLDTQYKNYHKFLSESAKRFSLQIDDVFFTGENQKVSPQTQLDFAKELSEVHQEHKGADKDLLKIEDNIIQDTHSGSIVKDIQDAKNTIEKSSDDKKENELLDKEKIL